jgi:serine/threonine protein kinase
VADSLVIDDRYEVIRRLAVGGMGEIFLARQTAGLSAQKSGKSGSFSRLAILKTLRPELAEQPDALDQFLDEARVAALLSHPNIVAIYDVGVHSGVHFIAMEYIGGIDLAALVRAANRKHKPFPARVAAAVVRDAATGLDYAHHAKDDAGRSLKVVHRDVSPHNLMVRADGIVKVLDFGVAVASNQMHETQGDKLKGKIRYMSPEQLLGEELDGRSDEFSLGIVLWELLAGKPMFVGNNPIDVFQRILGGNFPRPSESRASEAGGGAIPPALEDIAMKMLRQKRTDRYPRCADAAAALRSWLDASGPGVEEEVQSFVHEIAGDFIADRVRDLTPRAVNFTGLADMVSPFDSSASGSLSTGENTSAPTRILSKTGAARAEANDDATTAAPKGLMNSLAAEGEAADAASLDSSSGDPAEHSEGGVLLDAVEHSGILHGDRHYVTVLVGLLPGWGALVQQIANVPMGAFGVSRLKNLFFRQLQQLAVQKGGNVIRHAPDAFIIAFGTKEPGPKDAEHALACAFATQKILDDLAKDPRQRLVAHMGIASGTGLTSDDEDGPMQLAGSVVEKAERLAALARSTGKGILVSAVVGELARGQVSVHEAGSELSGEPVLEATGVLEPPTVSAKRKKILIADDAEVFRKIEEEILRPFAYAFVHAKDGGQAVKLAVDERVDLVLLDVQMPVMDGVQVLSFLKRTERTKDIPVVVVTTIGRAHDEDLMRRGGADAFLTKPVKPGTLIQTVRKLLGE